ncbi:hypothetical protein EDEG_02744 [Edhazardia aedis USNM 41457]|uniref:V-type proton ATPase subunit n=1 Tax=Edhazardia aedis (strain USNM 41457) TaxID=1003232 RepID=J9D5P1_EDHAE|nr:hypothetical protein EDEG_02744 [Edhazardia aedis USNM 41457]|eukprot:EJW02864.1 hypothetical protein EDEG_02744 [Edhazardia aedis USNM 41457]
MNQEYNISVEHGFIIGSIHGKALTMLKDTDYSSLQQCDTLEDVIVKLTSTPYQKYLTEEAIVTKKQFKTQLIKCLTSEFDELCQTSNKDLEIVLNFFRDQFRIQNFVFLLASKEEEPNLDKSFEKIEKIGDFSELCALKVANDMNDVFKFCVENTFLEKFYRTIHFEREIKDNDMQVIQSLLLKGLFNDVYQKVLDIPSLYYFRTILQMEGDRRIIEIVINSLESSDIVGKQREILFPEVSSIDLGMRAKLATCTSMDELRGVVSSHSVLRRIVTVEDDQIVNELAALEVEKYWHSFGYFNDISCVYSYLKLKEQEIKNILWTVECISLQKRDFIKNIIVQKNLIENN